VIPELLEVDVLDRIDMLLTGGLATLHALLAMAPANSPCCSHARPEIVSLTGASACFCLALYRMRSPLSVRPRRLAHRGRSGKIGELLPVWVIPLVVASVTVVGALLAFAGSLF
jgi:hypothetical protein